MSRPSRPETRVLDVARNKQSKNFNEILQQAVDGNGEFTATVQVSRHAGQAQPSRGALIQPATASEPKAKAELPTGVLVGESTRSVLAGDGIKTEKTIQIKAESAESARRRTEQSKNKTSKSTPPPPPGKVSVTVQGSATESFVAGGTIEATDGLSIG